MIRVHVFCEGQTEELFLREILQPHFARKDIWLNPIVVRTGPRGKGGVVTYGKLKWQIEKKCKEDPAAWVTTLLDFYGLPPDFPAGSAEDGAKRDSPVRAQDAESAFQQDIPFRNFLAHLILHEFEALLFSRPEAFDGWFDEGGIVPALQSIRDRFDTPEHIDDGRETAPSKRIRSICRRYDKVLHGTLIALDIGLDAIRAECPKFDAWISRLERLGTRKNR
jgi:hypothetical protein